MPQSPATLENRSGPRYVHAFSIRAEWDTNDGIHVVAEGRTEAGGPFEISLLSLTVIGEEGLCAHQEWFSLEQAEEAYRVFDTQSTGKGVICF